jgi:hypothetical protein
MGFRCITAQGGVGAVSSFVISVVMPTEARRLVAEEGPQSKNTWQQKKELFIDWRAPLLGPILAHKTQ